MSNTTDHDAPKNVFRFPSAETASSFDLSTTLEEAVLSASGWRKVFGATEDDATEHVCDVDAALFAVMVDVCAEWFLENRAQSIEPAVVVGTDSRPTRDSLATICVRVLLARGITPIYGGIVATPEIMAYVARGSYVGFLLLTASHNPVGHNGLKIGAPDGAVISPTIATRLAVSLKAAVNDPTTVARVLNAVSSVPEAAIDAVYTDAARVKAETVQAYKRSIDTVTFGDDDRSRERRETVRAAVTDRGFGIVADFNGSARAVSCDREYFAELGVKFHAINDVAGAFAHRIVPEGESLDPCRAELSMIRESDPTFSLGYVPDADGDRGNLVYADRTGVHALHAQQVFALACIAELSWLAWSDRLTYDKDGRAEQKVAIAVNGPTSLRIERIAELFDARVFRAEVGEANVVELARKLRKKGYLVRVLGEGSNGGNIVHPAQTRDPIHTVLGILKLLLTPDAGGKPSPLRIWYSKAGRSAELPDTPQIADVVATLPSFTTTGAYETRAVLPVPRINDGALRAEYEKTFASLWPETKAELARKLNVQTWEAINYNGTDEIHGLGRTHLTCGARCGYKILFKDDTGRHVGFVWMRGSGTEPVFRVMADVEGDDPEFERALLDRHVSLLKRSMKSSANG